MSSPFVAEIKMFAGNFAPTGWAQCNGQLLPISQNTALFSLLGTFYGGDGKSTFALPDLEGRAPMGSGDGSGLSSRFLGESAGSETVTLLQNEIPFHNHGTGCRSSLSTQTSPASNAWSGNTDANQYVDDVPTVDMAPQTIGVTGGGQPHNNLQRLLVVTFIIAMQGVFPPRQ
ncbi:MAG TPA: phage tail protein [Blastocatellia bacterium]|nr:phage tail protein [Blastocatellia bacterium]